MGDGTYRFEIVGESHYQDALSEIAGGRKKTTAEVYRDAWLIPEPDNPYDLNAVAVDIDGKTVGYLPRLEAAKFKEENVLFFDAVKVPAVIVGGWKRSATNEGHFGVKLDCTLAFPMQPMPEAGPTKVFSHRERSPLLLYLAGAFAILLILFAIAGGTNWSRSGTKTQAQVTPSQETPVQPTAEPPAQKPAKQIKVKKLDLPIDLTPKLR